MIYCQFADHKIVQVGSGSETVGNWPPESGSAIQDNGSRDPDPEPNEIITDTEPLLRIRYFLGLPDPLLRGTNPSGASGSFHYQAKIMKDKRNKINVLIFLHFLLAS